MHNRIKPRLLITAPLIIALCVAAYFAVGIGIADLHAYSPRQHLEYWQKKAKTPPTEELNQALNNITTAIHWNPLHAEYRDMHGLLNYYQAIDHYYQGNQDQFVQQTQQSLADYQLATQLRPNWPYSWANIALMKASLQQFDAEYRHALIQATTLGPWENGVNVSVTEAGMRGWSTLDSVTQAAVILNIERGIIRNHKNIKQRIAALDKLDLVCAQLKTSAQRKRLCGF
ncbi:hypothetical protein Q4488_05590 [Amphritea sp. 1_MG-2023]|uniref:hypothetical protein n=1 Tax=Amphritea sp. 1_MG-2023 TaxID=3062670 RepID=UPI0026E3F43B|nr:hypothetical protein [Amphritea sp. 1_MG-2023]MDO6562853.1 hypothetical protein [Amphritea sp. 1_MG-2023]